MSCRLASCSIIRTSTDSVLPLAITIEILKLAFFIFTIVFDTGGNSCACCGEKLKSIINTTLILIPFGSSRSIQQLSFSTGISGTATSSLLI